MATIRRQSRADRRRKDQETPGPDRRRNSVPDLKIKTQVIDGNLLVWVANILVATNRYSLRDVILSILDDSSVTRVIINMEKIPYADSAGLGLLSDMHRQLQAKQKKLILYRVVPRVKQIIEILRLDSILTLRDH